jgi:hypothetical protein
MLKEVLAANQNIPALRSACPKEILPDSRNMNILRSQNEFPHIYGEQDPCTCQVSCCKLMPVHVRCFGEKKSRRNLSAIDSVFELGSPHVPKAFEIGFRGGPRPGFQQWN